MSNKRGRRAEAGFTLIELMIVVAIIGILAAIAIPNYSRFQLRSKSGEGKMTLAALRTAEESYFAEYQTYVDGTSSPEAADTFTVPTMKRSWTDNGGFGILGWAPEGDVFYNYEVVTDNPGGGSLEFIAAAQSDIDGDGEFNLWAYVSPAPGAAALATATTNFTAGIGGGNCAMTGTWTPIPPPAGAQDMLQQVGPCAIEMGQTVF